MIIKKYSEIIQSIVEYETEKGEKRNSAIKVEINYMLKTFNVLTNNDNKDFKFYLNSHESNMWIATCRAIINGIEEAKRLLKNNNESVEILN